MIRVLVVDDSLVVRRSLTAAFARRDDIEVVGAAGDPYEAREQIAALHPDVIVLDLQLPRMNGLAFLDRLMKHYPTPVVVFSSLTAANDAIVREALDMGAAAVVHKPGPGDPVHEVIDWLVQAMLLAAASPPERGTCAGRCAPIVAIGASTGGPAAIETILRELPATTPGVVIVQHMPAGFTQAFAARLNSLSALEVREACDGDVVTPGTALIAPGNQHVVVAAAGAEYVVRIHGGPAVNHQRPSVDVLFCSVARHAAGGAVGVLLTGMGEDGARGLLAIRRKGGHTIAEDETSCVVFGMPRTAIALGAARQVLTLPAMAAAITGAVGPPSARPDRTVPQETAEAAAPS